MLRRIETASIGLATIAADGLIESSSNGALHRFWVSHGHDAALSFGVYMFLRAIVSDKPSSRNRSIVDFSVAFSLPAIGEILQGLHLLPGTFDWYDFLAFGIGSGLAAITERFIYRKSFQKTIEPRNNPAISLPQ